jgi:hypothetical protein
MIVDTFQDYKKYTLLLQEGVPTTGIVTEKDVNRTSGLIRKGGVSSRYYITYRCTALVDSVPAPVEIRKPVSSVNYPKFSIGTEIEILYIPSEPEISEPKITFGPPSIAGVLFFVVFAGELTYIGLKG